MSIRNNGISVIERGQSVWEGLMAMSFYFNKLLLKCHIFLSHHIEMIQDRNIVIRGPIFLSVFFLLHSLQLFNYYHIFFCTLPWLSHILFLLWFTKKICKAQWSLCATEGSKLHYLCAAYVVLKEQPKHRYWMWAGWNGALESGMCLKPYFSNCRWCFKITWEVHYIMHYHSSNLGWG